jgi:hypothetical protein
MCILAINIIDPNSKKCFVFQFPALEKIAFPAKKTFGNLERNVVEKRQKESHHFPAKFYCLGGGGLHVYCSSVQVIFAYSGCKR